MCGTKCVDPVKVPVVRFFLRVTFTSLSKPFRSQALPFMRTTTRPPPYVPSFGAAGVPGFAPGYAPIRTEKYGCFSGRSTAYPHGSISGTFKC